MESTDTNSGLSDHLDKLRIDLLIGLLLLLLRDDKILRGNIRSVKFFCIGKDRTVSVLPHICQDAGDDCFLPRIAVRAPPQHICKNRAECFVCELQDLHIYTSSVNVRLHLPGNFGFYTSRVCAYVPRHVPAA